MPKQLTIRGVSEELSRRLARLGRERGQSVNVLARTILEEAVGLQARRARLKRYATWTQGEVEAFENALADQRVIERWIFAAAADQGACLLTFDRDFEHGTDD